MSEPRAAEPVLTVRARPAPFFRRRAFLRRFVPVVSLAVAGVIGLVASCTAAMPFQPLVTLDGVGGSKLEFLEDDEVQAQLLRHHVELRPTRLGSRESIRALTSDTDFYFPSGQPGAELVAQRRHDEQAPVSQHRVFVSPIVLGTYRAYAETLRARGVAAPQANQDPTRPPLYYDLDLEAFLRLGGEGMSWDDIGIAAHGFTNSNTVLARTSDVCESNSAGAYLGLVAYVTRGGVPETEQDAVDLARQIRPLLRGQGLPVRDPSSVYFIPEGREIVPIAVIYEHQYLAHQLGRVEAGTGLDEERVLLYPTVAFQAEPTLVAFNEDARRLAGHLTTDPVLRRRALELGYRLLDPALGNSSAEPPRFLTEHGVPAVPMSRSYTQARLPEVPMLEAMINTVGGCPV